MPALGAQEKQLFFVCFGFDLLRAVLVSMSFQE